MRFEYDERKNRRNLAKHDVDFETAQIVFEDPYALSRRDEVHDEEERYITLGEIAPGVVLFVAHTAFAAMDGEEVIRLISARAATNREKKLYEKAHKRAEAPNRSHRREKGRRH
jgi:uncharacterized DUF497 family protein